MFFSIVNSDFFVISKLFVAFIAKIFRRHKVIKEGEILEVNIAVGGELFF